MKLFGYIEYYYYRVRGKLNLWQASKLLSSQNFSSSRVRHILREAGACIGKDCSIRVPLFIEDGAQINLGENVFVNFGLTVVGCGKIDVGNRVLFGPQITLVTANHPLNPVERLQQRAARHGEISIQENVWLGANVTVCAGVTIGKNSVVGAGSVVTRDIPPNTFSAGVPCKPIRLLN